jgi:hypothetical protein
MGTILVYGEHSRSCVIYMGVMRYVSLRLHGWMGGQPNILYSVFPNEIFGVLHILSCTTIETARGTPLESLHYP